MNGMTIMNELYTGHSEHDPTLHWTSEDWDEYYVSLDAEMAAHEEMPASEVVYLDFDPEPPF